MLQILRKLLNPEVTGETECFGTIQEDTRKVKPMARSNAPKGAPQGRATTGCHPGPNPSRGFEQPVLIVADNTRLRDHISNIWHDVNARLAACGGTMTVTEDDLVRYFVTAIKVRVEHTTRRVGQFGYRPSGMSVHDGWALPTPLHSILSSIGQVRIGGNELIVFPVWDKSADALVMNMEERDKVSREFGAVCGTLGISVFREISADREGHQQTMVLVYMEDSSDWWATQPFAQEDAAAASIVGTKMIYNVRRGDGGADFDVVDTAQLATVLAQLPLWMPELRMESQVVARYETDMAKLA